MKMILAVRVEKVNVDLATGTIFMNGKNVKENKHVKLGSYHTLNVEPDCWLKLTKLSWDALSVEILDQALSSIGKTEIGAIVMQEGLAHVCLVNPNGSQVLQRVEVAMPKRKLGGATSKEEKAIEKFMALCLEAIVVHVRFDALKAIVIAGSDELKDDFYKRLLEYAQKNDIKSILDNKSKFIRISVPNGQPSALSEVLKEPRVATILADTKAAKEIRVLNEYHKVHNNDPSRTTFGPNQVLVAAGQCAVRHLLLSDTLFRSTDKTSRKIYVDMVSGVRENGGQVTIFATGSIPEKELEKLTGVAAILNFPLEEENHH